MSDVLQHVSSSENVTEAAGRNKIMGLLDKIQVNVERFRNLALKLEEDREVFLTMLDVLRNSENMAELNDSDRDEAMEYVDEVVGRCLTVDIQVTTNRDRDQEESLHQVNVLIDQLVVELHKDPEGTRKRCLAYMNACSSHIHGATDKNFENATLGCSLDDQKRIKKRLQGLLSYIDEYLQ